MNQRPPFAPKRSHRSANGHSKSSIVSWVGGAFGLLAATAVLLLLRGRLDKAHIALVYLLVVLGGSAAGGRTLGIVLSVAAFLAINFLFLPPYRTFVIADPFDWLVLFAFLVTGIVAAQLLYRANRLAAEAERTSALREADRLKDSLIASVSHDLRTPLTTIKGLAHDIGASSVEGDERAMMIEEEVDRLNRLVADLLDLSRLTAGGVPLQLEVNAAEDLMGAALQRVQGVCTEHEIRATLDPSSPILFGRFDLGHSIRILVNLLENACKYAPPGSAVDFTVRREPGADSNDAPTGDVLAFRVADRGPGVSAEERTRIFAPFYRPHDAPADAGSMGLGLAIARGLAESQGGSLAYEPRSGGGSVFTLRLPAVDLDAFDAPEAPSEPPSDVSPRSRPLLYVQAVGLACTLTLASMTAHAQSTTRPDSGTTLRFGGFVDVYYAHQDSPPPTRERSFAGGTLFGTQAVRHNEFNVNLAFAEATLTAPRRRGRLALQFGTSVQANYAGEPTVGLVSGPTVQQFLQEAFGGVKVGDRTWVDAGIFASNMGMEGFVSRDNLAYTRSLVADYSPYFSTGIRIAHQATSTLAVRLDVVNGWQNTSENNDGKGVGVRVDWTPPARAETDANTLSYYMFASEEADSRLRLFNGIGASIARGPLTVIGQFDVGVQRGAAGAAGWERWYGAVGMARLRVAPTVALIGRLERYADPDQVILSTGTMLVGGVQRANPALRGNGASAGADVQVAAGAIWRTELRAFVNREAIFPGRLPDWHSKTNGFAVTSLAVTF